MSGHKATAQVSATSPPAYFDKCKPKDYLRADKLRPPASEVESVKRLISKLENAYRAWELKPVNPDAKPDSEDARVKKDVAGE